MCCQLVHLVEQDDWPRQNSKAAGHSLEQHVGASQAASETGADHAVRTPRQAAAQPLSLTISKLNLVQQQVADGALVALWNLVGAVPVEVPSGAQDSMHR
jgi:hypothetical protein